MDHIAATAAILQGFGQHLQSIDARAIRWGPKVGVDRAIHGLGFVAAPLGRIVGFNQIRQPGVFGPLIAHVCLGHNGTGPAHGVQIIFFGHPLLSGIEHERHIPLTARMARADVIGQ